MYSNSEFKIDIEDYFKNLINEFSLVLANPFEGTFTLRGSKCSLIFNYDRGETYCAFKPTMTESSTTYPVDFVYKFLHPDKLLSNRSVDDYYNPQLRLTDFANMIESGMKQILNGDFSWVESYKNRPLQFGDC